MFVEPKEASIGKAMISAVTVIDSPRLDQDWSQVFLGDNPAYNRLKTRLETFATAIDERNRVRPTNVDFHPHQVSISISS
jgi:hypothetical protein